MSNSKEVRLICKQCAVQKIKEEEGGVVAYVSVPLVVGHERSTFSATLRCNISPDHHEISLIATKDQNDEPLLLDDEFLHTLVARINQVAALQPCGTAGICPSELTAAAIKLTTT